MSANSVPDRIISRLRSNLESAGIPATAADIEGIIAKGFLSRVAAFEELIEQVPSDTTPDYVGVGGEAPASPAPAASPSGAPPGEIAATAAQLRARQVSPVELVREALDRIAARDGELNAFQLVLADQALEAARTAEAELAAGTDRGPLHGIPVAIKDLLDLAGTPTTAGSKVMAGRVAASDAAAVELLRAAGAVIVGKTRMSEFAYALGSTNPHYGPTRNPRNGAHDTGGSSSGSGAAVAAGLVLAALGSDTGGSIRSPAALCGTVGLKPTYGRISLHGAVPLSWSLDHLGPLTRTVGDAAIVLAALAGHDPRDARTRRLALPTLDIEQGVGGLRVGVLRDDGTGGPLGSDAALRAWRAGLDALARAGAELVEVDLPEMEALRLVNGGLLAIEAAAFHEPMLRERLDDYGEFMRQRILAAFAYGPRAFMRAQQTRALLRRRCAGLFERVDLLSTPTMPDIAPPLGTPGLVTFTSPFNALGWPAITVPVGVGEGGLPLGLQLAGRPWDEASVLRAARSVELGIPDWQRQNHASA